MARIHTYYDNLKVAPNAPTEVIRAAYRALAKRYHPDHNQTPDAARVMMLLNEAWEVLSDDTRRARHDAWIAEQHAAAAQASAARSAHAAATATPPRSASAAPRGGAAPSPKSASTASPPPAAAAEAAWAAASTAALARNLKPATLQDELLNMLHQSTTRQRIVWGVGLFFLMVIGMLFLWTPAMRNWTPTPEVQAELHRTQPPVRTAASPIDLLQTLPPPAAGAASTPGR